MDSVYVCRRSTCRHIVAAFKPNMDTKQRAELMKKFTLAGYVLELATDSEVQVWFDTHCNCNAPKAPPLLDFASGRADPITGELFETAQSDGGVEMTDVDAAGEDVTPEADEADEQLRDVEDHQEAADDLLKGFLEEKNDDDKDGEE